MSDPQPDNIVDLQRPEGPDLPRIGPTGDCETRPIGPHSPTVRTSGNVGLGEQLGLMNRTADPEVGPLRHRQKMQSDIVKWVFLIIAATVIAPFFLTLLNVPLSEKHWEFLHIIFPAEIGLLTAAMAFYFDPRG